MKRWSSSRLTLSSDNAGSLGITVASDKTLIGDGSKGIIQGKGLRIVSGASNIIIQYVMRYKDMLHGHC